MSYESEMMKKLSMPPKSEVEKALITTLFKKGGTISEFSSDQKIVSEIADFFSLSEDQRTAYLETIYKKENRVKKSYLWHRLLFRAADNLSKKLLLSRPSDTKRLTGKQEWMLTEKGYDKALKVQGIPLSSKNDFQIKSYEVQKIVSKILSVRRTEEYSPVDKRKRRKTVTKKEKLRERGFRFAVLETYDCKCALCGLKLNSPDKSRWEVQAAHIVPHSYNGRDDILNGIALCGIHHWAFDVGWFTLKDNFEIVFSELAHELPDELGKFGASSVFLNKGKKIYLPKQRELYPHQKALEWHRNIIFNKYN